MTISSMECVAMRSRPSWFRIPLHLGDLSGDREIANEKRLSRFVETAENLKKVLTGPIKCFRPWG